MRPRRVTSISLVLLIIFSLFTPGVTVAERSPSRPGISVPQATASAPVTTTERTGSLTLDGSLQPLPIGQGGHDAFPSLVQGPGREVKLVYRHGTNHVAARDGVAMMCQSLTLGRTFSVPQILLSAPGVDFRDPALAYVQGELWVSWFTGSATLGAQGAWVQRGNRPPIRIDQLPYAAIAAPVRILPDGSVGAVYYGHAAGESKDSAWFARSTDGGDTWVNKRIADGPAAGLDFQEPWLVVRGQQLIVAHRYGNWDAIGITTSSDGGQTWSDPRRTMPSATGRPNMTVLRSGTIVMTYRDRDTHHAMLTSSRDAGITWNASRLLHPAPPGDLGMTYADIIQVGGGIIPGDGIMLVAVAIEDGATGTSRIFRGWLRESTWT
jgi:hypothetical protein